jgi:hypothetical protein
MQNTNKQKGRRTDRDRFLETLAQMGGRERTPIGNKSLRTRLNWNTEKYTKIKELLLDQNLINRAPGRGGAVCLAEEDKGLTVFVSYSHKDKKLKDQLVQHLKPLERVNLIKTWHDQEIKPGDDWAKALEKKLNSVDMILLLISIDFINSQYCYGTELEIAMQRHEEEEVRVIPILLRDCLWTHTPFSKLQMIPPQGKAVTSWPDLDMGFKEVAKGLEAVAKGIRFNL